MKWPFNLHDGGLLNWKRRWQQHKQVIERVEQGDTLLLEVADIVIQLRTNAERLEQALQKLREDEEDD